jgi:hypothetical protein
VRTFGSPKMSKYEIVPLGRAARRRAAERARAAEPVGVKKKRILGKQARAAGASAHYINLWLTRTPQGSIAFYLDNELYVRLLHWAGQRHWSITTALRQMAIKQVGPATDQRTLMERFDDWRAEQEEFENRPAALRWIVARMLARGS